MREIKLNIYLLTQDQCDGYDTYDSCIVAAKSEEDAKTIHPSGFATHYKNGKWYGSYSGGELKGEEYEIGSYSWPDSSESIKVSLIGSAAYGIERGLILASFNAGQVMHIYLTIKNMSDKFIRYFIALVYAGLLICCIFKVLF